MQGSCLACSIMASIHGLCLWVWMCACACFDTFDMHFFHSCCRAETERGLNRKHIIEGNTSIFPSSALSFTSPHHTEPRCSPVISLHLALFLPPSLFPFSLSSLHSLIFLSMCTQLNLKVVLACGTSNPDRCFVFSAILLQVSFYETTWYFINFKVSSNAPLISSFSPLLEELWPWHTFSCHWTYPHQLQQLAIRFTAQCTACSDSALSLLRH